LGCAGNRFPIQIKQHHGSAVLNKKMCTRTADAAFAGSPGNEADLVF
jgi:hypothetical protein